MAFTQHCIQSTNDVWKLYSEYTASYPSRREGYLKSLPSSFGLAVHQSVQVGSFIHFLGLVKLQGWLQAQCIAKPQFLKTKGT